MAYTQMYCLLSVSSLILGLVLCAGRPQRTTGAYWSCFYLGDPPMDKRMFYVSRIFRCWLIAGLLLCAPIGFAQEVLELKPR